MKKKKGGNKMRISRNSVVILFFLLAVLLAEVSPVAAATFTVTNLNNSGAGSLRQAIIDANGNGEADTINFSVSGTITLSLTLLDIAGNGLTIDGTGQTVTVDGNNSVGVFRVGSGRSLTLNNLTIANGRSGAGGGIINSGTLDITNCAFFGNSATDKGGGIYTSGATVTITNSTFSGNSANWGGGIFNTSGTVTITNSTFSGNSATSSGGGIYHSSDTTTLRNTIVANSISGGNCDHFPGGSIISNGGNNIDSGTTCGWGSSNGSMSNTDPMLGALANNGGPTQTMALIVGSPAIDGVTDNSPNGAPATDQRGVARPQGAGYDIGAFEGSQQADPPTSVPTMNEWGMILFIVFAGLASVYYLRMRTRVKGN